MNTSLTCVLLALRSWTVRTLSCRSLLLLLVTAELISDQFKEYFSMCFKCVDQLLSSQSRPPPCAQTNSHQHVPMVLLRGEDYVGRVPSRRPSHSASTSGSNPPWRTWQIALATPAHSAVGVVAAWPGLHTSIPSNPSQRPRSLRGSRALEVKLNRSLTGLSASLLLKLYSFTQLHTGCCKTECT